VLQRGIARECAVNPADRPVDGVAGTWPTT